MCGLYKLLPTYTQIYFRAAQKFLTQFLGPCILETVVRTLFFTLPKLR